MTRTYHAPAAPARIAADPTPVAASPRADRLAGWALKGPLTAAVVAACAFQWLAWAPQYLTWPWFADHDVFATMARSWEEGLRPYRDVAGNNFPGTIYLHWGLGKIFGWGRTAPFYALDAAMVAALGGVLLAWSRRRFGAILPGAIGLATFLGYYLTLDYTQAAQRDWQGPALAVAAILAVEAWPGRAGRIGSALAFAAGLAIRPQPVLLLPALASALAEGARARGEGARGVARSMIAWGLAAAAFLALAFAPLALAGLLGDFLRGVRPAALGGTYGRVGAGSFARQFATQLADLRVLVVPAAVALLAGAGPTTAATRGSARTWGLAMAGVLFYRPLSPHPHAYLTHPLMLVWAVEVAVLAQVVLARGGPSGSAAARLAALLVVMGLGGSAWPRFAGLRPSLRACRALARGEAPAVAPLGYVTNPAVLVPAHYEWADYRDTLAYLKAARPPSARVANVLVGAPALAGPSGRLSALPAESLAWLQMVRPADEAKFAAALERPGDTLVVWSPAEAEGADLPRAARALGRLGPVIRRSYHREARFGAIEVWRRGPSIPSTDGGGPAR